MVGQRSKFGTLLVDVMHSNEEYGYMALYFRLKGIVPPSSDRAGRKIDMRAALCTVLVAGCLTAQVRFAKDLIAVNVDGKPFTVFHYGAESGKPYLSPIRSASGKIVTRRFPMESAAGESTDHLHHTGLWFSFDDVNGVKFWENDPSYKHPNMGRIAVRSAEFQEGDRAGTLSATMEWRGPHDELMIVESRKMVFYSDSAFAHRRLRDCIDRRRRSDIWRHQGRSVRHPAGR
ncbi:MAG: DUF6807 family protein [Ignavibacteriota bacterium]